jgi:hypothetical protein
MNVNLQERRGEEKHRDISRLPSSSWKTNEIRNNTAHVPLTTSRAVSCSWVGGNASVMLPAEITQRNVADISVPYIPLIVLQPVMHSSAPQHQRMRIIWHHSRHFYIIWWSNYRHRPSWSQMHCSLWRQKNRVCQNNCISSSNAVLKTVTKCLQKTFRQVNWSESNEWKKKLFT